MRLSRVLQRLPAETRQVTGSVYVSTCHEWAGAELEAE